MSSIIWIRAQPLCNSPASYRHWLVRRLTPDLSQQSSGGLGIRQSDRVSMSCSLVCKLVLCIRQVLEDSNTFLY